MITNATATRDGKSSAAVQRSIVFTVGVSLLFAVYRHWLLDLAKFALQSGEYSHILVIPWVAAVWVVWKRHSIVADAKWSLGVGTVLLLFGMTTYLVAQRMLPILNHNDQLALVTTSLLVLIIGAFTFVFGTKAVRAAAMPIGLMLFLIPIPTFLMERIIYGLQVGSAEVTYGLFRIAGIPVLRNGLTFDLPGIQIVIAKECSGIRSTLASLIASILMARLWLSTNRARLFLALATLPISLLRNGVRIFVLSSMAVYVDRRFLTGVLHREGGVPFFVLALVMLAAVLNLLRRSENMAKEQPLKKRQGNPVNLLTLQADCSKSAVQPKS